MLTQVMITGCSSNTTHSPTSELQKKGKATGKTTGMQVSFVILVMGKQNQNGLIKQITSSYLNARKWHLKGQ